MIGLTRKQRDLYNFIAGRLRADGVPPSFDEMCVGIGVVSKSRITELVNALEERGYIRRLHNRARAIEIVKRLDPDTAAVTLNAEILALTDRYAAEHQITRDTAVNEALRQWFGAAA